MAIRSRISVIVAGSVVLALGIAGGVNAALWPRADGVPDAPHPLAATPVPLPSAAYTPPPPYVPPPPAFDLSGLPVQDAFAVQPQLPLDDDPNGGFTGLVAIPDAEAIPVFASAGAAQPVAQLPRTNSYGGTVVPIVKFDAADDRVEILIPGRQSVPSPGQLTAWVRTTDLTISAAGSTVEVNLTARTLDIVGADGSRERVASDFGSGAPDTPTPLGRTFIMTTLSDAAAYVRGHLVAFTAQQSPALGGFDGQDNAVIAFHYYDERSGPISNGCIRLDAGEIDRIDQLPAGTPVVITA